MNAPSTTEVAAENVILQADSGTISTAELEAKLSPQWLTRALSIRFPGVAVTQSSIDKVFVGFQLKIWVRMRFNEAGVKAALPEVMVVKSGFNRHGSVLSFSNEGEMLAYRDLIKEYPINAPRCFYSGMNPDGDSQAIIIEDLFAKQVRFCHALTPLNYDEAARFLDALARFHSYSWNLPALRDESSELGRQQIQARQGLAGYVSTMTEPETWASYIAAPRGAAIPKCLHDRDRFLAAFERLAAFDATQPLIIQHGDEHLGNLYIEKDGTPGFFDLQFRSGPWSQGIAYFIGCALDVRDRRKWDRDLVRHYVDRLVAYGVAAPSFDDAWDAYCKDLLFAHFIWLVNASVYQTESVNTANAVRCAWAVLDNDTFGRLGFVVE